MIRSAVLLSAALLLGRLIGFLREVLLASRLGVSEAADIAVVVLTLPDYLIALVLAGGFRAALVPALKRLEGQERQAFFERIATLSIGFSLLVALAIALAPAALFGLLAPSLPGEVAALRGWMLQVTALAVPLAALAGILGAVLNVKGIFFAVGLGSAVYNLTVCIAALTPGGPDRLLIALVVGVLLAAALRVVFLVAIARVPLRPRWAPVRGADTRFFRLFAAGVGAAGVMYFAQILFRSLAAAAEPGALSVFAYALRLFELPMGLLLTPMATVLLPRLSTHDLPQPALMRRAAAAFLAVSLLATATGLLAGDPIARLIYERGEMTPLAMDRVIETGQLMFLALPFAALGLLGATVLNAGRKTGVVLQNTLAGLVAGGGLALSGPAMVLPGFILFYAVTGVLHVLRSGLLSQAGSPTRR